MFQAAPRITAPKSWRRATIALLLLAGCTGGAPRDNVYGVSSLGPFPVNFVGCGRTIDDPIFRRMECSVVVTSTLPRPTLAGRLNDPGSALAFQIVTGTASVPTCTAPLLSPQPSIAISRIEIRTVARALMMGADSPIEGTVTLADGRVFTMQPDAPNRLRLTRGNPDDVGDGLIGEFEFMARDMGQGGSLGPNMFVVRGASFAIYNAE